MTFSIGDVLEQLHGEFPDITVSKIRFLESQGLIAPMRTASGFRMFSETDISKLRWILSHQRDRFLPLKVIKEYLLKLTDADFAGGNSPSFDFETSGTLPLKGNPSKNDNESDTNVQTLTPVRDRTHLQAVHEEIDITTDSSNLGATISSLVKSVSDSNSSTRSNLEAMQEAPFSQDSIITRTRANKEKTKLDQKMHPIRVASGYDAQIERLNVKDIEGATLNIEKPNKNKSQRNVEPVLSLEKMTIETGISGPTLKELVRFSIIESTGEGNAMVFDKSQIEIAKVAAKISELGIEPRLLKTYVLFAGREVGYLEHVTQDDLRKRNPEAVEEAKTKAIEFIQQTALLKELLLLRAYSDEAQ